MAKLYVDTIEPEGATTNLAIGEAGQDVILPGNDIRANVLQDVGGNAIFTSDGSGSVTGVNSGIGSAMALISSQTATNSASLSFTSGIDSTYDEYIFWFININPASDNVVFQFNGSTDGGSNYNVNKTSSAFRASCSESASTALGYLDAQDLANSTAFQYLGDGWGNGADECGGGELRICNVSSTVYVKNFYGRVQFYHAADSSFDFYVGGICNTTSAVNAFQFKMSSGNFDGIIKMYGVK